VIKTNHIESCLQSVCAAALTSFLHKAEEQAETPLPYEI
jgi:hypothetical protein